MWKGILVSNLAKIGLKCRRYCEQKARIT